MKPVKSFLGHANFYRRHIPRMAEISKPLTSLTRKDLKECVWTEECEEAFERQLVTALLLYPPDLDKEFYLWTDASVRVVGWYLCMLPNSICHAVEPPTMLMYAPTELNALEQLQVYLLGNKVTVSKYWFQLTSHI